MPVDQTPVGKSAPFQIVVTYPDSDSLNPQANIVVPVGVYSGLVSSAAALSTATFTIHPPELKFGDTPTSGDPVSTPTPLETVVPGNTATTPATAHTYTITTGTSNDSSAVFPMSIKNTGTYDEDFTLVGTVPIKLADGSTVSVAVKYYTAAGALLSGGVTPVITAGSTGNFLAVIDVPDNAAATTGSTGSNPQPVVSQSATGNYSSVTASDNNDLIKVSYNGGITVAKTQSTDGTTYVNTVLTRKPGEMLSYKIVAKNTYNASVANFILKDSNAAGSTNAFTFTNFVSASAVITGFTGQTSSAVYYSKNAGVNWTTAAPTSVDANGIWVAVDTDNSGTITAADVVPSGATLTLTINTTVK